MAEAGGCDGPIRHVVFFGAVSPAAAEEIAERLRGYAAIPHILSLSVTRNLKCDAWSNEIDVVLEATFASRAALDAYKADPLYHAGTEAIRPLRTLRIAADYRVGE